MPADQIAMRLQREVERIDREIRRLMSELNLHKANGREIQSLIATMEAEFNAAIESREAKLAAHTKAVRSNKKRKAAKKLRQIPRKADIVQELAWSLAVYQAELRENYLQRIKPLVDRRRQLHNELKKALEAFLRRLDEIDKGSRKVTDQKLKAQIIRSVGHMPKRCRNNPDLVAVRYNEGDRVYHIHWAADGVDDPFGEGHSHLEVDADTFEIKYLRPVRKPRPQPMVV